LYIEGDIALMYDNIPEGFETLRKRKCSSIRCEIPTDLGFPDGKFRNPGSVLILDSVRYVVLVRGTIPGSDHRTFSR
jgi:hypothetical protein